MPTVSLTIDGRQVTVEKGTTVLQAAIGHDIAVPYYCYHPGLSVDGSCRVCIVKIEKMPKLQTSCSTACADGMVVSTRTDEVTAARAGVFEFLLVNHPLDCPVCDKGGECPLQDFSYTFGPDRSRTEFPRRVFDGEGVKGDVDFGPTLMLNRQRCILCTRCVRFMRDVENDAQINIIDRGYLSEIATFREEGVHSLMSGNLVDICPVGAITARDYRFASRPWDNPDVADTICTDCAVGCNTTAWLKAKPEWAKGSRLVRLTPRFNPDVNGYWMCDIGRYGYHWVESDQRLRRPLVKAPDGEPEGPGEPRKQCPVAWHDLIASLQAALAGAVRSTPGGVRFLLSAHASHEELFVFRRLADELRAGRPDGHDGAAAITVGWRTTRKARPSNTTFRISDVDAPNVNGARLLGLVPGRSGDPQGAADVSSLRAAVESGQVAALYVFDPGPEGTLGDTQWIADARAQGTLPLLIVQGVCATALTRAADFVLPGASSLEKEASYTNEQGRLQGTARVLAAPGEAREDWRIVVSVAEALGVPVRYTSAGELRGDLVARFAGLAQSGEAADGVHPGGLLDLTSLGFAKAGPAATWLQASNPSERWKWDVMYQDLPPVKGSLDQSALPPPPPSMIRLREVK